MITLVVSLATGAVVVGLLVRAVGLLVVRVTPRPDGSLTPRAGDDLSMRAATALVTDVRPGGRDRREAA